MSIVVRCNSNKSISLCTSRWHTFITEHYTIIFVHTEYRKAIRLSELHTIAPTCDTGPCWVTDGWTQSWVDMPDAPNTYL